jgi:colanic acid/amylovoran biosynthesis protein
MNIEIRGVNFVNKGAELMLLAVVQALQGRSGLGALAVSMGIGHADRVAVLNLHRMLSLRRLGRLRNLPAQLTPKPLRSRLRLLAESEIDVVLDASGFLYSDQWGAASAADAARLYERLSRRGKKIVLLPQAFGPFESKAVRKAVRSIVRSCRLVYARDKVSYDHLRFICGEAPALRQAPDFTNMLGGRLPANIDEVRGKACIIPNYRMLDKTDASTAAAYVTFLVKAVEALQRRGIGSYVLIHETKEDGLLVEQLKQGLGRPLPVIEEQDSLAIKGLIGQSSVAVGSRYHGLVSALAQDVPCIATGWSHKYQLLFEEYGRPTWLVAPEREVDVDALFEPLVTRPQRDEHVAHLAQINAARKSAVDAMWREVRETLLNPARGPSLRHRSDLGDEGGRVLGRDLRHTPGVRLDAAAAEPDDDVRPRLRGAHGLRDVARAMINAVRSGAPKPVLDVAGLREFATL